MNAYDTTVTHTNATTTIVVEALDAARRVISDGMLTQTLDPDEIVALEAEIHRLADIAVDVGRLVR